MEDNVQHDSPESEARGLGWVPLEEFRGNQDRWVDAETFLERGRTVMPLLKKHNEKLEGTVKQQAQEIERLKQLFDASQESIQELQNVHTEATKAAVEKARRDLVAELRKAKAEGDVDLEIQITEELADLKEKQRIVEATPKPAPSQASAPAVHPDFEAWSNDNPWYGKDERKTLKAMGIAQQLRADPENDHLQGRAFYDRVVELMEPSSAQRPSKVGESRPSASASSAAGKRSFSDLPADAKLACDRQGKKLVGEGRAFKTMNDWRQYYTGLYYQGENA